MSTDTAPRAPAHAIDRFLSLMKDRGASDLHLSVGRPPLFRQSGRVEPIRYRILSDADFTRLIQPITPPHLWQSYVEEGDTDFAYEIPGLSRFRVNLFKQERGMGGVFRIIPTKIMTLEMLGMPAGVHKLVKMKSGLVLVTGPTGSGKSTTLAAIIHEMNKTRAMHFVTIEDPIEFVHDNIKALVTQREVGPHSKSFRNALRSAVREDPDCILVGEMRDLETIEMALNAAETGLLVFGTLHTNSASKTMDRIINVFPSDRQEGVRQVLATVVQAVLSQQLLRRKKGGRVAALEVMFGSPTLASLIREGKTTQIKGYISTGKRRGMIGMDNSLCKLFLDGDIKAEAALEKALDKDEMRSWLAEQGQELEAEDAG